MVYLYLVRPKNSSVTIREDINRRRRSGAIVSYIGFAVAAVGSAVASSNNGGWYVLVPLLGFAAFAGGSLYLWYGIRCGHCSGPIGLALGMSKTPFSVPANFRYCPYCGTDLDTLIDARPPV